MNKETKVGLLVGLSFIVLFGVILSGREPEIASTPERTMVSRAQQPRNDNVQVVRMIELPVRASDPVPVIGQPSDDGTLALVEQPATVDQDARADGVEPRASEGSAGREALVPGDVAEDSGAQTNERSLADGGEPNPDDADASDRPAGEADAQMVTYTIKKGDTLVKIARTVCGDSSAKTLDRIFEANRDKMANKATCVIGKTLQIPVAKKDKHTETLLGTGRFEEVTRGGNGRQPARRVDASANVDGTGGTNVSEDAQPAAKPAPREATTPAPRSMDLQGDALASKDGADTGPVVLTSSSQAGNLRHYQVQKGDTWYGMAAKFMGDASRWKELYALNDDIVPDAKKLRTGIRIRIPVRSEAATDSNNQS